MAESYKELYLHLFRETEKAIRILQKAQADCEELFLQQEPTVLTCCRKKNRMTASTKNTPGHWPGVFSVFFYAS